MNARYVVDENGDRRAGEETEKMSPYPGVVFEGPPERRRASMSGGIFDVWEVVDLYRGKGRERLFAEHPISERQLEVALAYYKANPGEIDAFIAENDRPVEYWQRKYPDLNITVREF